MNTATILYIKGEFQSLLDSMKTFCEQPHAVEPQTIEQIKAFYSKLLWINSPLENERKNHQAFGELDKMELMFANESEQNSWYQRREKLEKMMDRMIEHSSLLILLCQIIQFDPSQKTFDLVLQLLREIISFIQKELASLESEDSHLNYSIKDFQRLEASLNKFVSQADHVQGEQAVKFIDELKSKVEYYQLFAQEQSEKFVTEEAEVKRQEELEFKHQQAEELQQQITQLKRQHQEQLQNREAELSLKHQEQLNNYESQLKLQHQEQIKQREAELHSQYQEQLQQRESELHSQYQEQLQQRESELRQEEKERIKQQINELESQIKEREIKANIEVQNNEKKPDSIKQTFTLPLVLILLVPLLGIVGFSAQNTLKSKQEQNTVNIVEKVTGENNIKSAQILAEEAGDMIKNSPHPLTVWQTAQNKWQKSIQLLEAVSNDTANSEQIQKQLEIYRTDYNSVTQKIAQEQKAVNNLEAAQKLALEASVIVQNPPYPLTVWQTAQDKWQKAVNLLESIPEDAFIAPEAQDKLDIYRTNLEIIHQRVKTESL